MATDFKYATQSELHRYYPNYSNYDGKRQITGWEISSGSLYIARNTGLVETLFVNGAEQGSANSSGDTPDANTEWLYKADEDYLLYFNSASTSDPRDSLMEAGFDSETYFNQMLVDASMELNNLLDGRYATPLPKVTQIDQNTASSSQSKEYDAIVVKMTCYICIANLLRSYEKVEEADYYYNLVTNADRTGMVDRLNAGEFKLSYEIDAKDKVGKVNNKSVSGSMDIVEIAGEYVGEKYDLLKIEATTTGAYGVGKVKVHYYSNDKIWGSESDEEFVTGGLQQLSGLGGLLVRFQGASISDGDTWEIEVASAERKITNASSNAIQLTRQGYGA